MNKNINVFNKIVIALMIFIIILIIIAIGTLINEGGMRFINSLKNNGGLSSINIIVWLLLLIVFFVMIYVMLHTKTTIHRPSSTRDLNI